MPERTLLRRTKETTNPHSHPIPTRKGFYIYPFYYTLSQDQKFPNSAVPCRAYILFISATMSPNETLQRVCQHEENSCAFHQVHVRKYERKFCSGPRWRLSISSSSVGADVSQYSAGRRHCCCASSINTGPRRLGKFTGHFFPVSG